MCSAAVSIFSDFWQNAYLKNYHTNLCQIFMVCKIVTVDDQPKISFFFDPSRDVDAATNFCWLYPHN